MVPSQKPWQCSPLLLSNPKSRKCICNLVRRRSKLQVSHSAWSVICHELSEWTVMSDKDTRVFIFVFSLVFENCSYVNLPDVLLFDLDSCQ